MVVLQLLLIVPFGPEILQLPASDAPSRWNRDHAKPAAPIISSATPTLRMALRPRVPIRRPAARTMIENHSDECTAYPPLRIVPRKGVPVERGCRPVGASGRTLHNFQTKPGYYPWYGSVLTG